MNAFDKARLIEERGLKILRPYLEIKTNGRYVLTYKGRLSVELQESIGDAIVNDRRGRVKGIEIKIEEKDRSGNFFLETWSNLKFGRQKVGWMYTLKSDWVWYYFIEEDVLYVIDFGKLWKWAFEHENIFKYELKPQRKYEQLNKTYGRCVPIEVIEEQVGFKTYRPHEVVFGNQVLV